MIYGRQYVGNWLQHAHAVSKRYQDPALSALLVVQLVLIFVVEPFANRHCHRRAPSSSPARSWSPRHHR
jgi:hypothetical protein